jgi:anti-anti-sigma factor
MEHRRQLCSWMQGVPNARPQVPVATLRRSKWPRNSSHPASVGVRYSSLRLHYRLDSGVAVVTVVGEVDVAPCGLLREGLLRVVTDENYRGLVINLAGVNFIDSMGLGVLVGVWRRVTATDSRLALAMPSRQVRTSWTLPA